MDMYVVPLLIIGVPTNLLVFIVFSRGELSNCANAWLFKLLAVFDATIVFINIGLQNIASLAWRSIILYSDWTCRVTVYVYFISRSMSALTLSIITVERAFAVTWPLKLGNMDIRRHSLLAAGILIGVVCIMYFPLLLFVSKESYLLGGIEECLILSTYLAYSLTFTWIEFAMSSMLPVITMILSDILITCALRKSQQMICKHNDKSTNHVILMLLTASIVFIILRIPHVIFMYMQLFPLPTPVSCINNILHVFAYVAYLCDCIGHSINMFLYCITGCKFRKALKGLFLCDDCSSILWNWLPFEFWGKLAISISVMTRTKS